MYRLGQKPPPLVVLDITVHHPHDIHNYFVPSCQIKEKDEELQHNFRKRKEKRKKEQGIKDIHNLKQTVKLTSIGQQF